MHSDELWSNNDYRYYLAHHGVLGQKWGQRNGPPYPLDSDISTGKRLKASIGNAIKKHKENKAAKVKAAEEAKKKAAEEAKRREEEQRRKEEKEKQDAINEAKKKAIASADVKEINKHMSDMSTNELADAVRRAELNKQLQSSEINTTKFDKFMNRVDKTVKNVETGVKAWNTFAKLANTFGGKDLPIIGEFGRKNPSKEEDEAKRKQREKERKKDEEAKRKQREKDEASRRRYEERTRRQQDKTDIQKLKKLKSILSGAEFDKGSVDIIQAMLKAGWTREQIDSLTNNKNKQQAQHSAIFDEYVDEYLAHHGVRGQKWGQKNGPPYPLDSSISTGKTLRSAIKYGGKMTKEERAQKRKDKADAEFKKKQSEDYSDNKKQVSKFLARVALDAASGNPVGIASDVVRAGKAVNASIKNKKYEKERALEKEDSKTGFKLKSNELSEKEDLARVNPSFYNFDSNTKSNCMLCTTTYDLRRRGYDVTAKTAGAGFYPPDVKSWYPKANLKTLSGEYSGKINGVIGDRIRAKDATSKFVSEALSQGDGARGNIMVTWAGLQGGHSMIYEVSNGSVRILDGQSNKVYNDPSKILYKTTGVFDYARLDNVDFDAEAIKRCCR